MSKVLAGYLLVIISGVLYGVNPILVKMLYSAGMNVLSVLTQRNIFTLIILFFLIRYYLKESLRVSRADFLRLFVIAFFANILTPILLQTSYVHISSGMSTTLHFVYPVVTVTEGALFFREKIGKVKWFCVAACTLGVIMFYTPGGEANLIGVACAIGSGITFGTYMVLLNHLNLGKMHPFKILFYFAIFGLLFQGGQAVLTDQLYIPLSAYTMGIGLLTTILVGILAGVFLQSGIRIIGAQRSAILSTCEPLTSILLGWMIFRDRIDLRTTAGIILILISVIALAMFDREPEQVAEKDA